jgi:hypothetical protein
MAANVRISSDSSTTLTRVADHSRFLDVALGRLLELVVISVEGARERLRGRVSVH